MAVGARVNCRRYASHLNGRKPDADGLLHILIKFFRDTMKGARDMDAIQVDCRNVRLDSSTHFLSAQWNV